MSTNKKRTVVKIYGHSYTIMGQENPAHVENVAKVVDNKMRELSRLHPVLDVRDLAILTAVNVVNDYLLLQERYLKLLQDEKGEES